MMLVQVVIVMLSLLIPIGLSSAQESVTRALFNGSASVATASTTVLAAKVDRKYLFLQNTSDTVMHCRVDGGVAVVGSGIYLTALGGGIVYDNIVPDGAITCIHAGSGSKTIAFIQN